MEILRPTFNIKRQVKRQLEKFWDDFLLEVGTIIFIQLNLHFYYRWTDQKCDNFVATGFGFSNYGLYPPVVTRRHASSWTGSIAKDKKAKYLRSFRIKLSDQGGLKKVSDRTGWELSFIKLSLFKKKFSVEKILFLQIFF